MKQWLWGCSCSSLKGRTSCNKIQTQPTTRYVSSLPFVLISLQQFVDGSSSAGRCMFKFGACQQNTRLNFISWLHERSAHSCGVLLIIWYDEIISLQCVLSTEMRSGSLCTPERRYNRWGCRSVCSARRFFSSSSFTHWFFIPETPDGWSQSEPEGVCVRVCFWTITCVGTQFGNQ